MPPINSIVRDLYVLGERMVRPVALRSSNPMSTIRSRLYEIPPYEITTSQISAERYNLIRLALLRLGNPLRFPLPRLRGLDMVIGGDYWACVDRTLNDLPVVAWTEFQSKGRNDLCAPVGCRIRYYHAHASMILERLFADLQFQINDALVRMPRR